MMIEIYWTRTLAKGCTDLLPMMWFEKEGTQPQREHIWLARNGTDIYPARCSLEVRGEMAVLNYAGIHTPFNEAHDVAIGELKLEFSDRSKSEIIDVYWRLDGAEFKRAPVVITVTGDGFDEGDPILLLHMRQERSRKLRNQKIVEVKASGQRLTCEACRFLFSDKYGEIWTDFCEVHHRVPLSVTGRTLAATSDLATMCSNCHRMIHRTKPMITVEEFAARHIASA